MGGVINDSSFFINGSHNKIIIGEGAHLSGASLWIEDNNCTIKIGKNIFIGSHSQLACTEDGSEIQIGDDCMIAPNTQVRTGDSHSIFDVETGERINRARSIMIANHCWLGDGVKVLKGVNLPENTIVSTSAVVTHSFLEGNVIIGGIPAKVIKSEVNWDKERR